MELATHSPIPVGKNAPATKIETTIFNGLTVVIKKPSLPLDSAKNYAYYIDVRGMES